MIAAQYEIVLPADYDMEVIRRRVRERGSALDARVGLGLKAYLVRDVADGSAVNSYSPFYLWREPAALAAFHWGGQGFSGIVRDFGRPVVRTWVGGGFARGVAFPASPAYALVRTRSIPPAVDPVETAQLLSQRSVDSLGENVHSRAWGIDPSGWQSVEFTLLAQHPGGAPDPEATLYSVLHLSSPEIEALQ
ncbi:DUF4865 family protein [Leifsonia sp. C5G2]|uniref:DUF4865 family protein n=1 Tax=Leifsonia sp. C5G2 TaxID=2735269 RepID=UPI001584687F|nr:DUF4865 family protein [Leifsonia sp. C5G2]NUU07892.1 DUF4865 family protein [Leifsonia sp. C5G2]